MYQHQVGAPVPAPRRSGLSAGVVVLLWIFVGWPISWFLLFLFAPLGILFGIGITIGMIVAAAMSSSNGPTQNVVINVGAMPPPAMPQQVPLPAVATVRQQIESLASINAVGGCGWCGSLAAHLNDSGYPVHPRFWHAAEIEERVRVKTLARGT